MTWSRSRWIQLAFGAAIWIGLIITVIAAWEEIREELVVAGLLFPLSVLLVGVGLVAAARGWSVLQPLGLRRRSMVGFLAAQPAKYLPAGGALQALGQVGLTTSGREGRKDVAWTFLIHAGVQAAAATLVAILFLVKDTAPAWVRLVLVGATVGFSAGLRTSVVAWVIESLSKLVPRLSPTGSVPSTPTLWRSTGWAIVPLVMSGAALALLLGFGDAPLSLLSAVGAFAAAWAVGFVLFPLPAGLGAREAVLVALLPSLPSAQILGVSLIHRFSTVVAELILLSVVSRRAFVNSERCN